MSTLKSKVVSTAVVVSLAFIAMTKANATEVTSEQVISQFVISQGKQVMANLSEQLQRSIQQNIAQFSIELPVGSTSQSQEMLAKAETKQVTALTEEE
ncbi:hypothetical protein [Colwellia sp. MEBiC06753]